MDVFSRRAKDRELACEITIIHIFGFETVLIVSIQSLISTIIRFDFYGPIKRLVVKAFKSKLL